MNTYLDILEKAIISQQGKFIFVNIILLLAIILGTIGVYVAVKYGYKIILPVIIILQNAFLVLTMFVNLAIFTLIIDGAGEALYRTTATTSSVLTTMSLIGVILFIVDMLLFVVKSKKKIMSVIVLALTLILFLIMNTYKDTKNIALSNETYKIEMETYADNIDDFVEISTDDLLKKINNNEKFILYVGRDTGQWCRKLVPILNEVAADNKYTIFYLNSENTETDLAIKKFRYTYNIKNDPEIVYFDSGTVNFIEHNVTEPLFDKLYLEEQMKKVLQ